MTKQTSTHQSDAEPQILRDVVCALCGCCCDDLAVTIRAGRVIKVEGGCAKGRAALHAYTEQDAAECVIDDNPASVEKGVEKAVELLRAANRPLILGLQHATCEAQRVCASIADRVGGVIDAGSAAAHAAILAAQQMGQSTCTWGEAINRADLILFWGVDPSDSCEGLLRRLNTAPKSDLMPSGGASRTYVYVNQSAPKGAKHPGKQIKIPPSSQFESLWTLRALAKGIEVQPDATQASTGVALTVWDELFQQLKQAKYAVIFFGQGLTGSADAMHVCEALFGLVRDLNAQTRICCNALPSEGGNAIGAENVLTWRTGFPMAVDFARGYPRFGPHESDTHSVFERNEADVALTLAPDAISVEVLGSLHHQATAHSIRFQTATYGVSCEGTIHRADGVALPLRAILRSKYPSHEDILRAIERTLHPNIF